MTSNPQDSATASAATSSNPLTATATRMQILAKPTNFYPVIGLHVLLHSLLTWLPDPTPAIYPALDPAALAAQRLPYILHSALTLIAAITLALTQSAILSFGLRSPQTALLLPLNLIPFLGASITWAAGISVLKLVSAVPNSGYERYIDMAQTFVGLNWQVSRGLFVTSLVVGSYGLYQWMFAIGRDRRQVTGYEKKRK